MIGILGSCACLILFVTPNRWTPYAFGLLLLATLAVCPFALKIPGFNTAIQDRVILWGNANTAFKEHPLFGVGFGHIPYHTYNWQVAHNSFAECYAELGLFGYWFWFLLVQLGIVSTVRIRAVLRGATDPEAMWLRRFTGLGLAGVVGYFVSSYFLSRAHAYPTIFLVAMFGAVPRVAWRWLRDDQKLMLDYRRDVLVAGTLSVLGSIAYIYFSIRLIGLGM